MILKIGKTRLSRQNRYYGFTPLEKAADFNPVRKFSLSNVVNRRSTNFQADDGLMPPSALTVSPVRDKSLNGVRECDSSLTGFTLIELAIVASIILMLAAVATPLFRNTFRDLELRDSAYNISKLIRYAEVSAVMEEKKYKMIFDFEKKAYWILRENEKGSNGEFERLNGRFGSKLFLPEEIAFKGDKNEIIFLPNGRSTKAVISIVDADKGKGLEITATGKFGRVEISDAKEK